MTKLFEGKRILVTGGTGSLGSVLAKRLLSGKEGVPERVVVFSRDETKQHFMRLGRLRGQMPANDILCSDFEKRLTFKIGDVRSFHSVSSALRGIDIVFNAAALKQVPTCEYFPYEAVLTNVMGPQNIIKAITEQNLDVETVVGVSTDKACKPVNVMGMTKAIQERIFINANLETSNTRFTCVRYGNVLASRGSVIPLFHDQIRSGGPVTITTKNMTRFLLSLNQAVDTIFAAVRDAQRGETYIPKVPSARVMDIADALIGDRRVEKTFTGIRPGEKTHEILISEEEGHRTVRRGQYYVIRPILQELTMARKERTLNSEYSSADELMSRMEIETLLSTNKLMLDDRFAENEVMLV